MKNIVKITLIILITIIITGCGEMPQEARNDEKNYKDMIEQDFKQAYNQEFIIQNDETVKSKFLVYGHEENTTEHIIDAVLKDDSTFKFRICTGFEEVPTLNIAYNFKTNYKNIRIHRFWEKQLENNNIVSLQTQTKTVKAYSECLMEEYADYLVFNPSSSVEEIATVLYNIDYNVTPGKTDFIYGDTEYCIDIGYYKLHNPSVKSYIDSINEAIENAKDPDNNYRLYHFCV